MKRIRNIKVTNISQLSPNMKRITFHSKDLFDFPENEDGGYVKLLFKQKSSSNSFLRPYTIRSFRKKKLELDIDFSNHFGNQGYATKWASRAKIGDEILISGPGLKKEINENSDWFFFVGDMTAIPAIACYLERIPKSAVGFVVLEIISKDDKIKLIKPKNIKIKWVVKSKHNTSVLEDTVKEINWLNGKPYVWVACEFNKMRNLRNFFQKNKKISKNEMYISSYWKLGLDQEEHKLVKKEDSVEWDNN